MRRGPAHAARAIGRIHAPTLYCAVTRLGDSALPPTPVRFKPLGATRTFEQVASTVREMLANGALKPGDQLPAERQLARQLRVSRSALREALRTLEFAGIITLKRGKNGGAFISADPRATASDRVSDLLQLGRLSWDDLTEARLWIVEIVVRVAAKRATAKDIAALERNIREGEAFFEQGRLNDKVDAVIEFHHILAQATRNPFLVMINQTILDVLRYFAGRLSSWRTGEVFRSRRRFMQAIKRRDADAAVREMQRYLKKLHREYIRLAREAHIASNAR